MEALSVRLVFPNGCRATEAEESAGRGGAGDPFRYTAAAYYSGPDKLPDGVELEVCDVAECDSV